MKAINSVAAFNELIAGNEPVVVDFYADWCAPCRALHPTLEDLSKTYDGKVTIAKVNVDDNQALAAQFNVTSIPTLLFVKDKTVVEQTKGLQPKSVLEKKLNHLLNPSN